MSKMWMPFDVEGSSTDIRVPAWEMDVMRLVAIVHIAWNSTRKKIALLTLPDSGRIDA
jgi:hypothetical protein